MKNKLKAILNDYILEFQEYKNKFQNFMKQTIIIVKEFMTNIKENFKNQDTKKKYLATTIILVILNLLIINIFTSFAYYYDKDILTIVEAKVGDINLNKYDYVLRVFLEEAGKDGIGTGKYYLSSNIPTIGYTYSNYTCQNGSILNYDEQAKMTSVSLDQKDICSIYFNIVGSLDIGLEIMLESDIDSNTYIKSNYIPSFGYKYSYFECENNASLEYDPVLHKVKVSTAKKDYCKVYFDKDSYDIKIKTFVENTYNTKDYIELNSIPANKKYILNEGKSICKNKNNERIDNSITYENGYIELATSEISTCEVYLNLYE